MARLPEVARSVDAEGESVGLVSVRLLVVRSHDRENGPVGSHPRTPPLESARRRDDAQLSRPELSPPDLTPLRPPRFIRPSTLIVAVLLLIIVVTAYAGHSANNRNSPSQSPQPASPTTIAPATSLLGDCLEAQLGYDALVQPIQPRPGRDARRRFLAISSRRLSSAMGPCQQGHGH